MLCFYPEEQEQDGQKYHLIIASESPLKVLHVLRAFYERPSRPWRWLVPPFSWVVVAILLYRFLCWEGITLGNGDCPGAVHTVETHRLTLTPKVLRGESWVPLVLIGEWSNLPSTNEAFTHSLEVRNAMDIATAVLVFDRRWVTFFKHWTYILRLVH